MDLRWEDHRKLSGRIDRERRILAIIGEQRWVDVLAGTLSAGSGLFAIFRTGIVAGWLSRQAVPHPSNGTKFSMQIRILGILFVIAGSFFVFVAIKCPK
jgi:hypothetical protein